MSDPLNTYNIPLPYSPPTDAQMVAATQTPFPPTKTPDPNWANNILIERALRFFNDPAFPIFTSELQKSYDNSGKNYRLQGWKVNPDDVKKVAVASFLDARTNQRGGKTFRKKRSSKKSRRNRIM